MPRVKKTPPMPSREKGQRSLDPQNWFLLKYVPTFLRPVWYEASMWRNFVLKQPVAIDCREAIISWMCSLDWKLEPRESTEREELKDDIKYYTRFFENNGNIDFIELLEWLGTDYLDIPFGGAIEVGREGDDPDGRVLWIEPLDGGTLFPSLNSDYPYGQSLQDNLLKTIWFPWYAINRIYQSPRTQIERKGWGMPPPEKLYLAMEMLNRGDFYYYKLLLDSPPAGILDLGDMEKTTAVEWLKAFQDLMYGTDAFKVPVLYEHTTDAKFVPFGKPPTEIMFSQVTSKYAALVASAYGVSPSDINYSAMGNGGETLAGSIRQERKTRRTGIARAKKKFKYFFDRLLPESLMFTWIDVDDELSVALGRARLASITAAAQAIDKRILSPKEARLQLIADGIYTISMPEDVKEEEFDLLSNSNNDKEINAKRPGMLGTQVPPSIGGQGEIRESVFEKDIDYGIERMLDALESKSDAFEFLPDVDSIANEWLYLVQDEQVPEVKEKISEFLKTAVPERFSNTYSELLPTLELDNYEKIAEEVGTKLANLRYNLVDDFSKEVINIVRGKSNGSTKKITRRRNGNNE